jgi:hypothetical protein
MHTIVAHPPVVPSETEVLDGIGRAFFGTLEHDGGLGFQLAAGVVVLALLTLLVRWVRREALLERIAQEALDARHAATMSETGIGDERREWVRVPAHVQLAVRREHGHHGPFYEPCETENLSGGGLSFFTRTPPALGASLQFTIDLGERSTLPLEGIVVRIEPPRGEGGAQLVAVKLDPITSREREHVIRWVAHEEVREIADARRGRLCVVCRRPLADDAGEVHTACATAVEPALVQRDERPTGPARAVAPSRHRG